MTLLMYLCPRQSVVVFEDGRFVLHADGNGTGTQVDQRMLGFLARLRLVERVRDANPPAYVINNKGRGALKSRVRIVARNVLTLTVVTLTGNACAMR